ncbi:glutathione transferase GstA [Pseudorhodoplanes sp.]|uniref:glutathione transferase GstA n=1 Tax=Pseudorhodoplanes sp. TaxID=1934341 RepID=UPI002B67C988|nr:glutathione transferase GstA [Pseudorhodoplanes sp.]HWV54509.1 glutathione transferase GstA [Pseudorhodoplanes sp.]
MKLYYSPGACSLAVNIALHEAGIPFDLERVDNKAKVTKGGENFWDVNPKGVVPVLTLDNGETLTEATTLLKYVSDQKPEAGLMPKDGTMDYYRALEWLNFIATELHKQFTPLFKDNTPGDYRMIAKENVLKAFALIDKHLAGRQWLAGDNFSVADIYLFTVSNWARFQEIDVAQWPNLNDFRTRVRARPKVQDAMKAEGLIKPQAA